MGKKVVVGGHKIEQSGRETQDAGAASKLLGATPSWRSPPREGALGRNVSAAPKERKNRGTSWVERVLAPSRTGTHGMEAGRRRQIPDSGSQAQCGSRARTQSTQLS